MSCKLPKLKVSNCAVAFFSSALQAFGMYNIHALSGVTEGGVLGATLLLDHWLHVSPAASSFVLNAACYPVTTVAEKTGFSDPKNFATAFKKAFGYPPSKQSYDSSGFDRHRERS